MQLNGQNVKIPKNKIMEKNRHKNHETTTIFNIQFFRYLNFRAEMCGEIQIFVD